MSEVPLYQDLSKSMVVSSLLGRAGKSFSMFLFSGTGGPWFHVQGCFTYKQTHPPRTMPYTKRAYSIRRTHHFEGWGGRTWDNKGQQNGCVADL